MSKHLDKDGFPIVPPLGPVQPSQPRVVADPEPRYVDGMGAQVGVGLTEEQIVAEEEAELRQIRQAPFGRREGK